MLSAFMGILRPVDLFQFMPNSCTKQPARPAPAASGLPHLRQGNTTRCCGPAQLWARLFQTKFRMRGQVKALIPHLSRTGARTRPVAIYLTRTIHCVQISHIIYTVTNSLSQTFVLGNWRQARGKSPVLFEVRRDEFRVDVVV